MLNHAIQDFPFSKICADIDEFQEHKKLSSDTWLLFKLDSSLIYEQYFELVVIVKLLFLNILLLIL